MIGLSTADELVSPCITIKFCLDAYCIFFTTVLVLSSIDGATKSNFAALAASFCITKLDLIISLGEEPEANYAFNLPPIKSLFASIDFLA